MIREMQVIKESRPYIEEINSLIKQIREKKDEKYQSGQGLSELKTAVTEIKASINKIKKNQDDKESFKESIQKQLDKINQDRNLIRKDIADLKKQKDLHREEYYKKLIEYEKQQVIIKEIEWIIMIKGRVEEREEQKK